MKSRTGTRNKRKSKASTNSNVIGTHSAPALTCVMVMTCFWNGISVLLVCMFFYVCVSAVLVCVRYLHVRLVCVCLLTVFACVLPHPRRVILHDQHGR